MHIAAREEMIFESSLKAVGCESMTAPQSAGVLHTEFERGFIRVKTIRRWELLEGGLLS